MQTTWNQWLVLQGKLLRRNKRTNNKASLERQWFFMEDEEHIASVRFPKKKFIEKYYKDEIEIKTREEQNEKRKKKRTIH